MLRRSLAAGIALVAAFLLPAGPASAGGGGCATVSAGEGVTVELVDACITPTLLRAEPGQQVTFVNRDAFAHVITGAGYAWGSSGNMKEGDAFAVTFDRSGVYPFQCYLHPGMAGAVIVGDATGPGAASQTGVTVEPLLEADSSDQAPVAAPAGTASGGSSVGWWVGGAIGLAVGAGLVLLGRRAGRREASIA